MNHTITRKQIDYLIERLSWYANADYKPIQGYNFEEIDYKMITEGAEKSIKLLKGIRDEQKPK